MKFTDPYYKLDPTTQHDFVPVQGRTNGGRFTRPSILTGMGDSSFPVDSRYWSRYAKGVIGKVVNLRDRDFADRILSDDDIIGFSWRMICEMFEEARDALQAGKTDDEAVAAAHDYLKRKQIETAKKIMDATMSDPTASAIDQSDAIDQWMTLNWENIPEVEL